MVETIAEIMLRGCVGIKSFLREFESNSDPLKAGELLGRFKGMLEKHLEIAGVFFYPKLESVLNQETQIEIIEKAKGLIGG